MKKFFLILIVFTLIISTGCSATNEKTQSREPVSIIIPEDDSVNGYRISPPKNSTTSTEEAQNTEIVYIGNTKSHIFHKSDCPSIKNTKDSNKIRFKSRDEAIKQGYTPCKRCKP